MTAWNSTFATSWDFVDTGCSRSPTMHRSNRSIATVSSTGTHRNVTGSIANTSNGVVSRTTNSPGRVARSRPYTPFGRSATDRLALPLPNACVPLASCFSRRYAVAVDGIGTTPDPCSASTCLTIRAITTFIVGVEASVRSASTCTQAASHRGSTPLAYRPSSLLSARPATPESR